MGKLTWTLLALLVYLVCAQMPLYGIAQAKNADPFYIMRMVRRRPSRPRLDAALLERAARASCVMRCTVIRTRRIGRSPLRALVC